VSAGEGLLEEARRHMIPNFGLRVSILLDANGANTTAAAAVREAGRQLDLNGAAALVLGATGPVGQRVVRLLARQGAEVRVGSRQKARSAAVCEAIRARVPSARLEPVATATPQELADALAGRTLSSPPEPQGPSCCHGPRGLRARPCAWRSTSTPCRRWASRVWRSPTGPNRATG
jgi:hypothetical protein